MYTFNNILRWPDWTDYGSVSSDIYAGLSLVSNVSAVHGRVYWAAKGGKMVCNFPQSMYPDWIVLILY